MITFKDFLNESPLPDTWDKDKFKQRPAIKTFRDIIEYASEKATEIVLKTKIIVNMTIIWILFQCLNLINEI